MITKLQKANCVQLCMIAGSCDLITSPDSFYPQYKEYVAFLYSHSSFYLFTRIWCIMATKKQLAETVLRGLLKKERGNKELILLCLGPFTLCLLKIGWPKLFPVPCSLLFVFHAIIIWENVVYKR